MVYALRTVFEIDIFVALRSTCLLYNVSLLVAKGIKHIKMGHFEFYIRILCDFCNNAFSSEHLTAGLRWRVNTFRELGRDRILTMSVFNKAVEITQILAMLKTLHYCLPNICSVCIV